MNNIQEIFKRSSPWMRLSICSNLHIKKALLNVVHNRIKEPQVNAIPDDSTALYTFLQIHKNKIKKSTHIKEYQKSILLPTNSQHVDSASFDISLIRFLIQTFNGIKNAKNDWKKTAPTDQTLCAYVFRAADFRNQICHDNDVDKLDVATFEKNWEELKAILQGLKYDEDIEEFKTETLEFARHEHVILEEFVDHLRSYREECLIEPFQNDYIQRRFYVDGNKNDIVTESDLEILMKDSDCIIIHGEAGIGKSSMAKRLKNEWCAQKVFGNHDIIYYDSKRMNKQLTIHSNAAALFFSEMGDFLKKKGRTIDDLSIYSCVKTIIDDLLIVIDGIDEFPVKELVNGDYVDELERKIVNNEKLNSAETISAIYFGHLFPYSKIIILGRIGEFDSLKKVKVKGKASIFNRRTKNLELLKFDDANIKDFSCLKICKQPSQRTICTGACQEIYNVIKNIELCRIPTDLNSLIKLCKKNPNKNIGKITRTKLIITSLLNRLNEHVNQKNYIQCETFGEVNEHKSTFIDCIRTLGEITFNAVYKGDILIKVEKETINGIDYFRYENRIDIERKTIEELDLFYVRDFDYYFILEPHHTLNIEFLSACYLFSHPDEWDSILKLSKDRQLVIILFIAGLHADDYFTKDLVKNVLNTLSYSLEQFFSWLYDVEDVRESLPNGGDGYSCWFGLIENQKLSPSFYLISSISYEIEIPQTFIPKTIVCFCDRSFFGGHPLYFEWYDMEYFQHIFLTKLSNKLNIESFLEIFSCFEFVVKGNVWISNHEEFNQLNQYIRNNFITFKIDKLHISTSLETWFNSNFNFNTLHVGDQCDSRTIDMILNAILHPPTNTSSSNSKPAIICKRLRIDNITHLNSQQTEKLFELCLVGVVDSIELHSIFFTDGQLAILKNVERNSRTIINIELMDVEFNYMFGLPNLGNRHICVDNKFVKENNVIELKEHISTGYTTNLSKYKIIDPEIPFNRKENHSRDCKQSMYLNLCRLVFTNASPEVFAKTFSLTPSLSCDDSNHFKSFSGELTQIDYIPSSHWMRLSKTEDCQINEMRIWKPQPKNFEHFLNIKTKMMQFICESKDDLKQLLDHIVNNQNIQLEKEIKVFVVVYDQYDRNYYDETMLFSGITVKGYRNNYYSYNLKLDDICVPFHEGQRHLWWCCEISALTQKNINLAIIFPTKIKV